MTWRVLWCWAAQGPLFRGSALTAWLPESKRHYVLGGPHCIHAKLRVTVRGSGLKDGPRQDSNSICLLLCGGLLSGFDVIDILLEGQGPIRQHPLAYLLMEGAGRPGNF